MVQRFLETAILGAVRIAVAQMPFSEVPGSVVRTGEKVGHGRDIGSHHRAALANGRAAVTHRVPSGHQLAARGRTHGRHVEVRKPHTFGMQPVHVRCLDHRIAVRRDVAVALIIGNDEDDVGRVGNESRRGGQKDCQGKGYEKFSIHYLAVLHEEVSLVADCGVPRRGARTYYSPDRLEVVRSSIYSSIFEASCFSQSRRF